MSRLARYLRERNSFRTNGWLYFLILGNRTCNAALLLVGLALIVSAGDLYVNQPGGDSTAPAWPRGPPPASTVVFAAMGAVAVLTAAAALGATSCHSLFLLNVHLGLLALLLAAQVCLMAAVAAYDNGVDGSGTVIPDREVSGNALFRDVSGGGVASGVGVSRIGGAGGVGGGNSIRRDLSEALMSYKWADAVTLAVEVVTLLAGCLLHSAYMRADQRAEDMEEGLLPESAAPLIMSRRREAQQQQTGGGRRAQLPPRVVRDDPWSRRMREQYGLDTSVLSYDPAPPEQHDAAGPLQGAAAVPGEAAPRGRCIIS